MEGREIKFRAWNRKEKEMSKPFTLHDIGDGRIRDVWSSPRFSFPISDCTILQFTGLKDKNDKEIYEGNIVNIDKQGIAWYVVYGYFGDAKFYVCNGINSGREIEDEDNSWVAFITEKEKFELAVIGNIYEDARLIG